LIILLVYQNFVFLITNHIRLMAKEYYKISYKTYFNERVKPVLLHGEETYPLYVQVTYDRETIFFKSYYFDLFSRAKYDHLRVTLPQMVKLESRVIDNIIARNVDGFNLGLFERQYKMLSRDLLDSFDGTFKAWLAGYLREEKMPGLGAIVSHGVEEVSSMQLWDDLRVCLDNGMFKVMEEQAARFGGPYLPLAAYVRHELPKGPFCLPLHEWLPQEKRIEIEDFIDSIFWRVDMGEIIRVVRLTLHPKGIW